VKNTGYTVRPVTILDVWVGQSEQQLRRLRQLRHLVNMQREKLAKHPALTLLVGGPRDDIERWEHEAEELAKVAPFDRKL